MREHEATESKLDLLKDAAKSWLNKLKAKDDDNSSKEETRAERVE